MDKHFKVKFVTPNLDELSKIGFDSSYSSVGINKHIFKSMKICDLTPVQANILKQTALSVGTDCAVHRSVITNSIDFSDCILSGSVSELNIIAQKLRKQPFGLKQLADDIITKLNFTIKPLYIRNTIFDFKTPLIMGILNVTPDSFSDGGEHFAFDDAIKHFESLRFSGANIVDIGGESTRPGAVAVSVDEEIKRILPVIKHIRQNDTETVISVDTQNSVTAKAVLESGADIINDVSGLEHDKNMIDVLLEYNCPYILGHSFFVNKTSTNYDCVDELFDYFYDKVSYLEKLGVQKSNIIIDPCLGFDKTSSQNIEIIKRLKELKSLGCAVLVGHSRKRFIKELSSTTDNDSLDEYTVLLSQIISQNGADIIRVHNVKKHIDMLKISNLFL